MANFHSDDELDQSIPEIVYNCISLIETDNSKRDSLIVKCQLCKFYQRCFYCIECVRNGDFTHSKKKCFERFAEKKPKKYKLDEEKSSLLKEFENKYSKKIAAENLKQDILRTQEKIELLKKTYRDKNDELSRGQKTLQEIQERKDSITQRLEKLDQKLATIEHEGNENKDELNLSHMTLRSEQCNLEVVTQRRIRELVSHIFPISKVLARNVRRSSSLEHSQYRDLEEAQKTTYVQGQWVIAGSPVDDGQYCVVQPCLPRTGDYSAVIAWGSEHDLDVSRDNLSSVDRYRFDTAHGITAALAYTAQMVNVLSFYLDTHVPKRSNFIDFCKYESEEKFLHNVAKLNANVFHLCLHRNVALRDLQSKRTVSNLLLVLDPPSEEAQKSMSGCDQEDVLESLEDSITKDLLHTDESDDDLECEFVHISDEEDLEEDSESQQTPPAVQPSFVSSVYSLWRAATGGT